VLKALVVFLGIVLTAGCVSERPAERVLFDFETDADLDRMHWQCFTLFSLSEAHATHGERSLKMSLFPSQWPGWSGKLYGNDWRGYGALAFDVYNPQEAPVSVTVRIDDRKDYPDYGERFNRRLVLAPGENRVVIGFDELVTSEGHRPLDLKRIYRLLLFMASPVEVQELYLDHVRLVGG